MPGPISPQEVPIRKAEKLPEAVFQVFNDLITMSWNGREAAVLQNDAVNRIRDVLGISRAQIFAQHLLDVEEAYEAVGWSVEFDKPAYNEVGEPIFRFRKK